MTKIAAPTENKLAKGRGKLPVGDKVPKPRGFAAMSPEKRAAISSKGGKATDPTKRYFSVNPDAASVAGAIGGAMTGVRKKTPQA